MKKKVFINESANEKSALTKPVHKITHWKKCAAMGLSMAITAGTLAGCGSSGGNSSTAGTNTDSSNSAANTSDTANGNGAAGEKTFNGVDISEHVDLKMYLLGDRTPDFDEVYERQSQGGPWYQYFHNKGMYGAGGTPNNGELILYNTQNPENLEFTYIVEWDGFREYCIQAKEMADAGCWSRDVLNSTEERQTGFLNGNAAAMIWNRGSCLGYAKQANKEHPEWKATICDCVSNQPKKVNSYINNGVAININSKNPERAMMVLNEFYTNPAVYDLAMLGIEGKHWEAVGNDQYKIIDETNFGADSNCNWGWKNADINRTEFIEDRTEVDDTYDAMVVAWDNNVKAEHVYDGFSFNTAPVQTQVAAVEAALGTYYSPLINGMVDDVDATIAELGKVLDQAGMQDIIKELEKQAAEYVASK